MEINSTTVALTGLLVFSVGYWFAGFMTRYRWMRFRRRIACLFGKHVPGRVQPAVGGRNVQRCDWCDKVVREYQVTKSEVQNTQKIRRLY